MKIAMIAAVILLTLSSVSGQEPPLVDGDCSDYVRLKVKPISVSNEVSLYIHQDKHFVWMCYTYPEGSFGTTDIKLKTSNLTEPLNLHVSAQLGEWPADKPELAPRNPESDIWWNAKGWTANTVWINGMDRTGPTPRYRFKNARAREIQLSKSRFGKGVWTFSMEIRNIKGPDSKTYDVTFPKSGKYSLKVL